MKIQLTGTGSILTEALSASALINDSIQIDIPNGYCKRARQQGVDFSKIDVVIFTHFHGDHYFDFPFFLLEVGLRQERETPLVVWGPQGVEKQVRKLHELAYSNWDRVQFNAKLEFKHFEKDWVTLSSDVSAIRMLALPVRHEELDAYGFVFDDGTSTFGYTGDTEFCDSVDKIVEKSNLIVADASFLNSRSGHMGLLELQEISEKKENANKTFVATHMSDQVRNTNTSGTVQRPNDGTILDI